VHAHVGNGARPLAELVLEVVLVNEGAARQEVASEVLHAALDLPPGLSAVGPAEPRLEAPVVGERLEGRIPDDLAVVAARGADRARPVVEMLACMAAEMREGRFVGIEELSEPLVGAGPVEAAAAEAERQHEDVQLDGLRAEVHARLPPVDLALPARRRLEAS